MLMMIYLILIVWTYLGVICLDELPSRILYPLTPNIRTDLFDMYNSRNPSSMAYIILQILALKMLGYSSIFFFYKGDSSSLKHLYLNICESSYIIASGNFIYINFNRISHVSYKRPGPTRSWNNLSICFSYKAVNLGTRIVCRNVLVRVLHVNSKRIPPYDYISHMISIIEKLVPWAKWVTQMQAAKKMTHFS